MFELIQCELQIAAAAVKSVGQPDDDAATSGEQDEIGPLSKIDWAKLVKRRYGTNAHQAKTSEKTMATTPGPTPP